jgi:hypothetical protein
MEIDDLLENIPHRQKQNESLLPQIPPHQMTEEERNAYEYELLELQMQEEMRERAAAMEKVRALKFESYKKV